MNNVYFVAVTIIWTIRKNKLIDKSKFETQKGARELLSKYESGKRIPPTETLITLADYYDVSMDYIMGRTNNPNINK